MRNHATYHSTFLTYMYLIRREISPLVRPRPRQPPSLRRCLCGRVVGLWRGGGRLLLLVGGAHLDPLALEPAPREVVARVDAVLAPEELDALTLVNETELSSFRFVHRDSRHDMGAFCGLADICRLLLGFSTM